jgi:hypothetical protein
MYQSNGYTVDITLMLSEVHANTFSCPSPGASCTLIYVCRLYVYQPKAFNLLIKKFSENMWMHSISPALIPSKAYIYSD